MDNYHCEECGADLRNDDDPDGTGNLTENGWLCDDCLMELLDSKDEH